MNETNDFRPPEGSGPAGEDPAQVQAVTTYKDRIFRMLFKEKREFLELYNAMNGTEYDRPEDLTVTTLDNAIYMNMKNDVSFLLYDQLLLYEHQSTVNPNMPLRDLFYAADMYSKLVPKEKLYGSRLIPIPEPKFVVFYNGTAQQPERKEFHLSDAYETNSDSVDLELKVLMLNINQGYNTQLMEKCRTLRDYMIYVSRVRRNKRHMSLEKAVEKAITECIAENVLADFLKKNRAEVLKVSIYEYNEEEHMRVVRDEGIEKGGILIQIANIQKMFKKGLAPEVIVDMLELEQSFAETVIQAVAEHPETDAEEIYDLLYGEKNT